MNDEIKKKQQRRTLGIVFFTVFIDLVGFGIIIPIQPFFAESLGASPSTVTLLGGSFSLMQFLFAPIWGRLSDKVGRRPIMLVSIGTTAVGYTLFGFASSLPGLFFARMVAGIGSANIGTAQAIIADSTVGEDRAKGMGLIGAAFGLGFIFGPALGGVFGQFGLAAPAFVAAALSLGNWIFAYFQLPESYPAEVRASVPARPSHPRLSLEALRYAARHVNVPEMLILFLVYTIAFSLMEQTIGLFVQATWVPGNAKRAAALTSYALIVVGVTSTIVQGGLIGRLTRQFGEKALLLAGLFLVGSALLVMPWTGMAGSYLLFVASNLLLAGGAGMVHPTMNSLLSRAVSGDEQGSFLGLGQSLSALGRVLGPSVAGILFQWHTGAPFWLGGSIVLACLLVAGRLRPTLK